MAKKHPEDPPDPMWDETKVRKHIKQLFDWRGWRTSHTYRARSPKGQWLTPTDVGFPDLVCLRPPSLVVLEVKSVGASTAKDRQREQNVWLNGFAAVPGCEAYQVNSADWPAIVDLARDGCGRHGVEVGHALSVVVVGGERVWIRVGKNPTLKSTADRLGDLTARSASQPFFELCDSDLASIDGGWFVTYEEAESAAVDYLRDKIEVGTIEQETV